jgi:hypothetical protein
LVHLVRDCRHHLAEFSEPGDMQKLGVLFLQSLPGIPKGIRRLAGGYQVLPTTSWVDPSSTGEPRRWGALRNAG